jgi:hypothetical protein
MRELTVDHSETGDQATPNVLVTPQLHTANDPLCPRLKTFQCLKPVADFIPFIPLFLSPNTINITIYFATSPSIPTAMVALIIRRLPTLCPNLEFINIGPLPRDSVITKAVSEMLLGCNKATLECFLVDSPLTEEACRVLYQLPNLSGICTTIRGPTSLPPVSLPNLTLFNLEYDHLDWLQGFRGVVLEKLEWALFHTESEQIGDFLGTFENIALTASTLTVLSRLEFHTSQSWNPNYHSLLRFTQLEHLEIEFHCGGVCSSRVDDDIIISIAQAMPKLQDLQLGGKPCRTSTGVTIKGLITLAYGCPHLSNLCIHFEATNLVQVATGAGELAPSADGTAVRWEDCSLTSLTVGDIPIQEGATLKVTITLLRIFPHLSNIEYSEVEWQEVVATIQLSKQVV